MTNCFWGYVLWFSAPVLFFALSCIWSPSELHQDWSHIWMPASSPWGTSEQNPPPPHTHLNATKIGHQARYKRVICSFFVCIMLLHTFKILFVPICLLCFDSRKAGGEYTEFLPITALNSNTIKYTVRSHVFQVTDQFCFNLVCLIYHTSWSVSLKKYVERLLFSTDSCLQFMPWKEESAQMNPDKIPYKTNKNQHAEMPAVIALFCHKRSVGQSNHVDVVFFPMEKRSFYLSKSVVQLPWFWNDQ